MLRSTRQIPLPGKSPALFNCAIATVWSLMFFGGVIFVQFRYPGRAKAHRKSCLNLQDSFLGVHLVKSLVFCLLALLRIYI